ncbi:MAG: hypothetical protein L6Q99_08545 [Planctomycetes bacterium]|nr:hypothetical protein [Planctomycetota bacterium]
MRTDEPVWSAKQRRRARRVLLAASLVLASAAWTGACVVLDALGFVESPLLPTVAGPESPELLARVRGSLAIHGYGADGRFELRELPDGASSELRLVDECVAGAASRAGNVVALVVATRRGGGRGRGYELRVAPLDRPNESFVLASGAGELLNSAVALDATGSWLAVARTTRDAEFHASRSELELFDLEERRAVWSRPLERVGALGVLAGSRAVVFTDFDRAEPVVRLRAFDGAERPLATGTFCALDREHELGLLFEAERFRCVALSDGAELVADARLPGLAGAVIGLVSFDGPNSSNVLALYEALPTEGAKQARHRLGLRGPSPFSTLKVADLRTGSFATLVSQPLETGSFLFD